MLLEIVSVFPSGMMTIQGIWNLYTTSSLKPKEIEKVNNKKKRICVIFPCYKDVVDIDKWVNWSPSVDKIIIAEDVYHNNVSNNPKVEVLTRNSRDGFKAGALNMTIEHILKSKANYDYIFFFDADHIPTKVKFDEINKYLNKPVIQFFWDDGQPYKTAIDNLTYSARYFSNINNYNRHFKNLTGSAMAFSLEVFKNGYRFPESITEDYALTLDLLENTNDKIAVVPLTISVGKAPKSFKTFIKQQNRWAEGTIRDARLSWTKVKLTVKERLDWFMQVNIYLQGLWFFLTMILLLSGLIASDLIVVIGLMSIQLIGFYSQLRKAPVKFWLYYFFLNYIVMLPQTVAVVKGMFKDDGYFDKTHKKSMISYYDNESSEYYNKNTR